MNCFTCANVDEYMEYVEMCLGETNQCVDEMMKILRSSELRIRRYLKVHSCFCSTCDNVIKEAIYLETYYRSTTTKETEEMFITEEAYNFLFIEGYLSA